MNELRRTIEVSGRAATEDACEQKLVMSIDNFIWVPIGARNNRDGDDTKYKSGDLGSAANYTRHQVSVTHGRNVLIDERYLFQDEMDARWFWEEG